MQYLVNVIIVSLIIVNADPAPSGGANCTGSDCGPGGICDFYNENDTGICVCFPQYGNINCAYKRSSRTIVTGLQIGLAFISINGVGNFILGLTEHAVGQLLLGLSVYICIIPIACLTCCGMLSEDKKYIERIKGICGCLLCIATLAGFIWTIYDGAMMANVAYDYQDANGYSLY